MPPGFNIGLLTLTLVLSFGVEACRRSKPMAQRALTQKLAASSHSPTITSKPDFEKQIVPILQSRCLPCHFQGGKVYDRLPFDKSETVTKLGTKLFTRIKDEKEQQLIREYLAQP